MNSFLQRAHSLSLPPYREASFWIIHLNEINEEEVSEASKFLDQETLNKARRMIFEKDQQKAIVTYAIVRYFLSQFINQEPHKITILRNHYGKPYLQNSSLNFNLSHTKIYALLGCHSQHSIGVDIETIYMNDDILKALEKYIHPDEQAQMSHLGEQNEALFSLWCAKEAFLKARGTGFFVEQLPILTYVANEANDKISHFISNEQDIYVYNQEIQEHKLAVCLYKSSLK